MHKLIIDKKNMIAPLPGALVVASLVCLLSFTPLAHAGAGGTTTTIDFENLPVLPAQPNNFAAAGVAQTYSSAGVFSISGGVVLGNPTFLASFAANGSAPNLYGTADFADPSLQSTITLNLPTSSQLVTNVSGKLFNGQPTSESYTVKAFSGATQVDIATLTNVAASFSTSSFASFSLTSTTALPITQVVVTTPNATANGWDFFVDTIVLTASAATTPSLSVAKTHVGTFTQGGTGEWDITVSNAVGSGATSGTTTVSDTLPAGYTVANFSTTDASWSCGGATTQTATCTSTQAIAGGASFLPVKIIVNIPAASPTSVMNTGKAFGGGDTVHTNLATAATGSDTVTVVQVAATIMATAGTPQSAQISTAFATNLQATVKDANTVGVPNVSVTFQAPAAGASGTFAAPCSGTTCTVMTNASGVATATTFTANSTVGGPYTVTAMAGAVGPANFMLTNTAATPTPSLSVGKVHVGTFTQGGTGEWDITVSNAAGSSATTGTTTVSDTLPTGYTVNAFTGTDPSWACGGTGTQTATCTSSAAIAGGSSFLPVKIIVNIPAASPTSVMNIGKAFGGGDTVHTNLATAAMGSDTVTVVQVAATIMATAGTPQSALVNTAFATNLQATVKDANSVGVPNVSVTFQAPAAGASGTFGAPCSGTTCVVMTNAAGVATATTFTANSTVGGPYNVTAMAGAVGPANFALTNTAATPTPSLSVVKAHVGTFTQGGTGEWDITVSNAAGSSSTTGTTTVSDTLPTGYTVNAFTGTDPSWACGGTGTQTATCTSTQAIAGGSSFLPVKIIVNIPAASPTSVMNTGKAFGGGDTVHTNLATAATGSDTVTVVQVAATIMATAGTPQSAQIGMAFATNLQATVKDANSVGVPNVSVTFQAPAAGASGTFAAPCGGTTCVVMTNAAGVATATTFTANSTVGGPYNVTAMAGAVGPANFALTNTSAGSPGPPVVTSVTPINGSGSPQTFTVVYTDPAGNADLSGMHLLFNSSLNPANACWAYYVRSSNSIFLINDAGNGFAAGSVTPGGAGTATNSQCTISSGGPISTTANTLTLPVAIAFKPSFFGSKQVWGYAAGANGQVSGWTLMGNWTPSAAPGPPVVTSVIPINSNGSSRIFNVTYTDPAGQADLSDMHLLFNTSLNAVGACWTYYQRSSNTMFLVNDAGNGFVTSTVTPGGAGFAQNSQCAISSGGPVTTTANTLTLPVEIMFNTVNFAGTKQVWGYAAGSDMLNSGWTLMGTWKPL